MIYLFTVGLSLSGKSWLVEKIKERFPKSFITIESRSIHDMLNTIEPFQDDNSPKGSSYELRQEFTKEIRELLIKLFAKEGLNIIQDSCNLKKEERQRRVLAVREIVPDVKIFLIFVDTHKKEIERRANDLDKEKGNGVWKDLFIKQIEEFDIPTKEEADFFIHYNGKDWESVIEKISQVLEDEV